MEVYKIFATMSLQDLISSPLQKIQTQMKGVEQGSASLTNKFASLGKAIAPLAIASGVLLGVFGQAVAKASEFEQSMAATSTMFGLVAVDTQNLNDKILNLSSSTGIAAAELNSALYNALSSGIPVTEDMAGAMDFMTKSTRLAKAGFTDIDTAVSTTAKILNAYKMDVSETDKIHKILMQTQNYGITTVGELGQSLAQVTPTAAAMGVSFEQIGAALSSMTAQGTPTAQATTQLNGLFAELGKSGTQAQQMLLKAATGSQYAGKSFQDLMKAGVPMSEILDLMAGYAKKSGKNLLDMFSSIDAGKAALALSGANAAAFTKNLEAMGAEADVVGDAYNKVTNTLSESLKRFSTSKDALFISIGSLFSPVLKIVAGVMAKITQGITVLTKTKLGAFLLKAVAGVAALIAGIAALLGMFFLLKLAIVPITALVLAISWPVLAVIAVVGLLYLAFKNNFGGIADVVGGLWKRISLIFKGVIAVFQSLKDGVGELKGALAEDIQANGLVGVITTISKVVYRLWQFISGFVEVVGGAFSEVFINIQPLINAVGKAFSILGSAISFILSKFFNINAIAETNSETWGSLGRIIGTVVVVPFQVLGLVIGVVGTYLEAIVNNITAVITFFQDLANGVSLFEAGKKLISTFADGILSVIGLPKEILMNGLSSLRKLLPFSDAKEGPLSTLTLSGQKMMTTLAGGIKTAAPTLQNATTAAFEGIQMPDTSLGIKPIIDAINPAVPDIDMGVKPIISNLDIPDYETDMAVNSKNRNSTKEATVIQIHIADISLPSVKDGGSFIEELKGLALSLGVK